MSMYCYQCQEAAKGEACTLAGVCGKTPQVSNELDTLLYVSKGISYYADKAAQLDARSEDVDAFVMDALFTGITNVNFDPEDILQKINKAWVIREKAKTLMLDAGAKLESEVPEAAIWRDDSITFDKAIGGVLEDENEDIRSLKQLLIYGLKGMAAYGVHAANLGSIDNEISSFTHHALAQSLRNDITVDELIGLVMKCGEMGVKVMAILDEAHNKTFGQPEITEVELGVGDRPGILISGHDLHDLVQLLEQSKDEGIDIYTHSEMLPAHYYPELKKYSHLKANYGNAWWKQTEEFETFNGPILFTTNCLVPPKKNASYADKVFTTGSVAYPGFKTIPLNKEGNKDFSEIIELAKTCESPVAIEEGKLVGGFAHQQVLALADKVIEAVKSGAIKKFVVMAGCDGRHKSRDYYSDFARELPHDNVILTAGCAKYRYNKLGLGDIGGIPRVLDAGQCNDSYSLAVIALKLKEAFGLEDVNDLPIVYNIAWYEQKAVIVLLALLSLGVKNIHLGPTLPAFLSPNVANVLVENFGIGGITEAKEDIDRMILQTV